MNSKLVQDRTRIDVNHYEVRDWGEARRQRRVAVACRQGRGQPCPGGKGICAVHRASARLPSGRESVDRRSAAPERVALGEPLDDVGRPADAQPTPFEGQAQELSERQGRLRVIAVRRAHCFAAGCAAVLSLHHQVEHVERRCMRMRLGSARVG
jgi:hypothetical protein